MLTLRKFLRTLIGTASPVQITLACILGSLFGFLPITGGGWAAALLLAVTLLVLNANVFLAGVVAAGTKLVSIASAPVAFGIGHLLIDGPLQPVFRLLVNAPVTAWLGFDSYLAVGGLAIGLGVGIALGISAAAVTRRVRRELAGLESSSKAFKAAISRRSVRFIAWLMFGGIPAGGFAENEDRSASPVRVSGMILAILLLASFGVTGWMLAGGLARDVLIDRLTNVNGATVEIGTVRIDLQGRVEVRDLAVCDSERLDRNLIQANRLVADLDLSEILSRRFSIDLVEAVEVYSDVPRETPGRPAASGHVAPPPAAADPDSAPADQGPIPAPTGNLGAYLKTADAWRTRLEQFDRMLRVIRDLVPPTTPGKVEDDVETPPPDDRDLRDSMEDWLRRQIDLKGYAGVRATHTIEDHPTIMIRSIVAGGVRLADDARRRFDVYLDNVSTAPELIDSPPALRIRETDGDLSFVIELGSVSRRRTDDRFEFSIRNLPTDDISRQLVEDERPPFSGGLINADMIGRIVLGSPVVIAAPIEVELVDATIRIGGERATIPRLPVRLDVGGLLSDPQVAIDEERLAAGLRDAGHAVLAEKANSEIQKQLDDGLQRLEEEIGIEIPKDLRDGIGDALGGGLGDIFGGGGKKP